MDQVRDDDPVLQQIRAIFAAWPELGQWFTTAQLIKLGTEDRDAVGGGQLWDALFTVCGGQRGDNLNPKRLGEYLSAKCVGKVQPVVRLDPIGTTKVRVTARDGLIVGRSYLLAETDEAPELKSASYLVEKPAGLPDCAGCGFYVVRSIDVDGRLDRTIINQGRLVDVSYLKQDVGGWLASCDGPEMEMKQ